MDWKSSFDKETLLDGYRLYRSGKVTGIRRRGNLITALVDSTCPVEVQIEDGTVTDVQCSCVAGRYGHLCAHEAALLFAIESQQELLAQPAADVSVRPNPWYRPEWNRSREEMPQSVENGQEYSHSWQASHHPEDFVSRFQRKPDHFAQPAEEPRSFHLPHPEKGDPESLKKTHCDHPEKENRDRETEPDSRDVINRILSQILSPQADSQKESSGPAEESKFIPTFESARKPADQPADFQSARCALSEKEKQAEPLKTEKDDMPSLENASQKERKAESRPVPEQAHQLGSEDVKKPEKPGKAPQEKPSSEEVSSFSSLLKQLDAKKLSSLVEKYAQLHPSLKDWMIASMAGDYPAEAKEYLEQEAVCRLETCLNTDQPLGARFDLRPARQFVSWLDEQVSVLLEARADSYAADLIEQVLLALGCLSSLANEPAVEFVGTHLLDSLERTLSLSNPAVTKDVFSWIELRLDQNDLPEFRFQLMRLLERPIFERSDLAQSKYDLLVRSFDRLEKEQRSPRQKNALIRSIVSMEESWPHLAAANPDFTQSYGDLPAVLIEKARLDLGDGHLQAAEEKLQIARQKSLTPAQEEAVLRMLIEIDQKNGHPENVVRSLNELIFILHSASGRDIALLKALESDAEWSEDLRRLESLQEPDLLMDVYADLGEDEKLMTLMEEKGSFYHLLRHESRLQALDADRTAGLWLKAARELGGQLHDRRDYRRVALALKKASASPVHRQEAGELAASLKADNHRRHAFVEELEKAGF